MKGLKRLYSVLQLSNTEDPHSVHCIVVCQTKHDDEEVRRLAKQERRQVLTIVGSEGSNIYLNDF